MNLHRLLKQREADHKPLRVALLGAGKFGAMFMSQAPRTPGMRLVAVADLTPDRARAALTRVGWPATALNAASTGDALKQGKVYFTDDPHAVIASPDVDIVIDATGGRPPASAMCWPAANTASTSSWSTSRPTRWPGHCWRGARAKPASSIRWPMATSRR